MKELGLIVSSMKLNLQERVKSNLQDSPYFGVTGFTRSRIFLIVSLLPLIATYLMKIHEEYAPVCPNLTF